MESLLQPNDQVSVLGDIHEFKSRGQTRLPTDESERSGKPSKFVAIRSQGLAGSIPTHPPQRTLEYQFKGRNEQ